MARAPARAPSPTTSQLAAGNDDLMPSAPPAFPQPVSSLPRVDAPCYYGAYAAAAAAAAQQRPQQQLAWGPAAAAGGGGGMAGGASGLGYAPVQHGAALNGAAAAAAAAAAPYYDIPYDVAMAPFAAVSYGARGYGSSFGGADAALPLLTDSGFAGDMMFANRQVRHAFLRKVLALLTLQLLATAGIALPLISHKAVRKFCHANPWVLLLALIASCTTLLVLACSEAARRRRPANLLLLGALTLANGVLVGAASGTYSTHVLLIGLLITAAACLGLICCACQTGFDFTAAGAMLLCALVVLACVVCADAFLGFGTFHLIGGGCGALLLSSYLAFDLQLLCAGESAHAVASDEVVYAVLCMYVDPLLLVLHILRLGMAATDEDCEHP